MLDDWFLTEDERGNAATDIAAWTEGNEATPLVHGGTYFARLLEELRKRQPGDYVHVLDWRGDDDERLAGPGTAVGPVLAGLAERGVQVRGLFWRSHAFGRFSESENAHFAERVNEAGGEVLLDERVRRGGSHHQKLVLLRRPGEEDADVAFAGGIDLCNGRRDDASHRGDPQPAVMDDRYGANPAWHDVQLQVQGPAVHDLAVTFRERWDDPTPLDHRNPVRSRIRQLVREPRRPDPLPPMPEQPSPRGPHAVQVLRTYPSKRPRLPFAPDGERSVARAYCKAFERARALIYIEDQYLWSGEIAESLAAALRQQRELRLIAVVPRHPDQDGRVSGPPSRVGQQEAVALVKEAGGDRVAFYDLENESSRPIYVHAKVCVVDDVWATIGSDNLNRRSWTHDSELSCAVVDSTRDQREPTDPGGLGDGARVLARDLRLELWSEHLGVPADDPVLLDPVTGFDAWRRAADELRGWHASGRKDPRPAGRVSVHVPEAVRPWQRWWAVPAYRLLVDPDGRPRKMRRAGTF